MSTRDLRKAANATMGQILKESLEREDPFAGKGYSPDDLEMLRWLINDQIQRFVSKGSRPSPRRGS